MLPLFTFNYDTRTVCPLWTCLLLGFTGKHITCNLLTVHFDVHGIVLVVQLSYTCIDYAKNQSSVVQESIFLALNLSCLCVSRTLTPGYTDITPRK
jgi:hypothetical protein